MQPLSAKAGLKKIKSYQKKKHTIDKVEQDDLGLLALPPTCPLELQNIAATVQSLRDRDPTQFSKPSIQTFHITIKSVDIQLQKAYLATIEHLALQEKAQNEGKRKVTSRQSVYKGGPSATINKLREQKKARDEKESEEKLQKAKKKLSQAINQAKKDLTTQGIQARKDEKARLQQLKDCAEIDEFLDPVDLDCIHEPDKEPTVYKRLKTTKEFYPELVQQIWELEAQFGTDQGQDQGDSDKDDVIIRLEASQSQQKEDVLDYIDSSPPPPLTSLFYSIIFWCGNIVKLMFGRNLSGTLVRDPDRENEQPVFKL